MNELAGKNVLVLGLGVNQGGSGVARYLVGQGANVRVTDMLQSDRLAESLAALDGLPIDYTLGRHDPADVEWANIVVRNPGVPREADMLRLARELGKRIEMEMTLFFRACPSPIIGVTGTKGKTTTTTMIATLLRQSWPDVKLAGNMGRSAVLELDALDENTPVVIELSSFQIEGLGEQQLSPHVAVFTNLAEDHLDRYASFDDYARTKAQLAEYQSADQWLVYNRDDPALVDLLRDAPARHVTFGREDDGNSASFSMESGRFTGRWDGVPLDFGHVDRLQIPGEHAQLNALAAIAASVAAGASVDDVRSAIAKIVPVPDRMEHVATIDGVEFVNDTTATIPVAAIAALNSFPGRRVIVIAGGSEKHISLDSFADELAGRADAVVLLDGAATAGLERRLSESGHRAVYGPYSSMVDAIEQSAELARPGTVVLLSPGCASFGMFRNEFDRGQQFRDAVRSLDRVTSGEAT